MFSSDTRVTSFILLNLPRCQTLKRAHLDVLSLMQHIWNQRFWSKGINQWALSPDTHSWCGGFIASNGLNISQSWKTKQFVSLRPIRFYLIFEAQRSFTVWCIILSLLSHTRWWKGCHSAPTLTSTGS